MKLYLAILGLILPLSLFGQSEPGILKGTVTSNGEPVIGANVTLEKSQKGAATNVNGEFVLSDLEPGTYDLLVSAIGYKEFRRDVKVSPSETVTLELTLEQKTEELGEVVVTGTMRQTYIKESPVKVAVVTPQRLQQGKTSSNIMDVIDNVSGLSTQLNCGVCGTNAIRINGVEGANTAVLIDGMPIMGALASVYGLNGISPSIIDQIEVIKGPQSTLYGTQALGGVVNIITKNPKNTPSISADIYAKSTAETSLNIAASPSLGRFNGFVSGNVLRMENYFDHNNDDFNDVAKQTRISLFGKGTLEGQNGEQRLNIAGKLYDENRTGGTRPYTDDLRGSNQIYGESIFTRRAELMMEYWPAVLDQQLRFSGAFTHHDQDSYYGTEHYDAKQSIMYGQATWEQPLSDQLNLLIGGTARYQAYDDNTPATSDGSSRRFIPGVFTQAEISINNVTLLGGLRVDHHQEHNLVTAPRLSAKYSPDDFTTIRISGGTGFRVVNVFTEDHAALTGSREVVFTEDLNPERSKSITASIEHIIPFGSNPMTVTLDGFYTHFSNKIIPNYDQNPNLIVYENLDGFSVTRGFSINLDQNFTDLPTSFNGSFTLMDVYTQENGHRQPLTYAPDFTGAWGLTYQIREWGLKFGYTGQLVGPKHMPDTYVQRFGRARESPTYTVHDLKLTKEFANVNSASRLGIEAYLSAENIFDYTQGSPLVNASTPFDSQFDTIYTWGPIVGRTFSLGARLNIR
jgi:outer membrane receptor for ferrienterochelin and colicins